MPLPPSLCVAYSVETETLPPSKTPAVAGVLPWTCRTWLMEMTEQINWQEKQPSRVDCVSEVLRSLRHSDTKPRTTPHRRSPGLRRRGGPGAWIEEAARRSSFKGRKRAVVNQNVRTVLKVTMGKRQVLRRDRGAVERIMGFSGLLVLRLPMMILNCRTELWHSCGAPRHRSLILFSCLVPNSVQRSEDWRDIFY